MLTGTTKIETALLRGCAAILLAFCLIGIGSTAGASRPGTAEIDGKIKIYGCAHEDSCAIDYRADSHGRGVWILREVSH